MRFLILKVKTEIPAKAAHADCAWRCVMEYNDIIVGAGSSGEALAARPSEDPGCAVLLLEADPDYSTVEQTPADLLNTWVSVWRGGFAPRQFESGQWSTLDGAEGSY